jgi:hypothetical protein
MQERRASEVPGGVQSVAVTVFEHSSVTTENPSLNPKSSRSTEAFHLGDQLADP